MLPLKRRSLLKSNMIDMIGNQEIRSAIDRVARALDANRDYLTELDQALGDGDLGITAGKIASALRDYAANTNEADVGKYLAQAAMVINRSAPSSLGTLLSFALMRASKEVKEKSELTYNDLAIMLKAADAAIQERGKARPGDKTIVDAIHPAAEAFSQALANGLSLLEASRRMIAAAQHGVEAVTPLRSKIGRASWVGERTEGKVDPGSAAGLIILKAIAGQP